MQTSDVSLLRQLVQWRRKTGWKLVANRYEKVDESGRSVLHEREYDHPTGLMVQVDRTSHESGVEKWEICVDADAVRLGEWSPRSLRSAVDVLAAVEVIAPEDAPLFQAGAESLPWHYAVKDRYGDIIPFGEDIEAAVDYAAPDDDLPALTLLRWRQGRQETAEVPNA